MRQRLAFLCGLLFVLGACSQPMVPRQAQVRRAYRKTLRRQRKPYQHFQAVQLPLDSLGVKEFQLPSPNFNSRTPDFVIIHQTEQQSCAQSLQTLTDPSRAGQVSAHYLICKSGVVYQLVPENYRAWQAGISRWESINNLNSVSLGIELDNTGSEPFTDIQIRSLLVLLHSIERRYRIPEGNFIGHADIAPTRKQDPSVYFPWSRLAVQGFGYWRDSVLIDPPAGFNDTLALKLIGYDTRNYPAAVRAFKRHFVQTDIKDSLDAYDRQVLYSVFLKYLHPKN